MMPGMMPQMGMMGGPLGMTPGSSQIQGAPQGMDMLALLQALKSPMGMAQAGQQPMPMSPEEAAMMAMMTKNGSQPPMPQQAGGMLDILAMLTGGGGMPGASPAMAY